MNAVLFAETKQIPSQSNGKSKILRYMNRLVWDGKPDRMPVAKKQSWNTLTTGKIFHYQPNLVVMTRHLDSPVMKPGPNTQPLAIWPNSPLNGTQAHATHTFIDKNLKPSMPLRVCCASCFSCTSCNEEILSKRSQQVTPASAHWQPNLRGLLLFCVRIWLTIFLAIPKCYICSALFCTSEYDFLTSQKCVNGNVIGNASIVPASIMSTEPSGLGVAKTHTAYVCSNSAVVCGVRSMSNFALRVGQVSSPEHLLVTLYALVKACFAPLMSPRATRTWNWCHMLDLVEPQGFFVHISELVLSRKLS